LSLDALLGLSGPGGPGPLEAALREAAAATTVGGAFQAGYQAALRALVPDLGPGRVALCATEEGGAHPRAIATLLTLDGSLTGSKRWVTGGPTADLLLVLATTGQADGKNQLVLVRVDPRAQGVRIEPGPPTPFVPDVPHASVTFDGARVEPEALLPGDGWARWVKPFRTHEDLHVHAALVAHVLALGLRAGWPRELLEEGAALLAASRELARRDASAPSTHLALAGLLRLGRRWLDAGRPSWASLDPSTAAGLERDLQLLSLAERARAKRTSVAWGLDSSASASTSVSASTTDD
jgi:acyl-CoA dehydrogenase